MKKLLLLTAFICSTVALCAQNVQETNVRISKQDVSGYVLTIPATSADLVESAIKDKFENENKLKASKESGYRAYLNQPFPSFGLENYDIYYKVEEVGKKANKAAEVSLIVCSGNMNAITSQTKPETASSIKKFLEGISGYVQQYAAKQQLEEMTSQLDKLKKDKESLEKSNDKINKDIEQLNQSFEKNKKSIDEKETSIKDLENQISKIKAEIK